MGPPFDTIHRKRRKEGDGGAIGGWSGGDCVHGSRTIFRFFRESFETRFISLIFEMFGEIIRDFQLPDTSKYLGLNNVFT